VAVAAAVLFLAATSAQAQQAHPLWEIYTNTFKTAKYVDLTHAFEPTQPVWPGFGKAVFKPAIAGQDLGDYAKKGDEFTYDKHGFIATAYELTTDQYGTQLDPPAHWD
jgi:kynurenine formamidase